MAGLLTEIKLKELESDEDLVRLVMAVSIAREQTNIFLRTEGTAALVFTTVGIAVLVGIIALLGRMVHAEHDLASNRIFNIQVPDSNATSFGNFCRL